MKRIIISCNKRPVSISLDLLEAITAQKIADQEGSPAFAMVLRTVSGMEYITDEYVFTEGSAVNAVAAINPDNSDAVDTLKHLLDKQGIRHEIRL